MLHRITTYLLCCAMISMNIMPRSVYAVEHPVPISLSEAELFEKYPGAKVVQVTPKQYLKLENELQQQGYQQSEVIPLQLTQNEIEYEPGFEPESVNSNVVESQDESELSDDCVEKRNEKADEDSLRIMLDITDDAMNSGGSSGDDAAVLFVIVGTVVVFIWTLYVFKYFYDVSMGVAPCGRWNELAVVTSSVSTVEGQHAFFEGLRYSTGFRDGTLDVGIGFELGQTDILLSDVGTLELQGRYWLVGPVLRWRLSSVRNPSYFQMSFVGGSTEHDEVGVLAKASLGLLFGLGDSLQLGVNWGAMNINLNEDQGIITERSQYHYLYGLNVGFKF